MRKPWLILFLFIGFSVLGFMVGRWAGHDEPRTASPAAAERKSADRQDASPPPATPVVAKAAGLPTAIGGPSVVSTPSAARAGGEGGAAKDPWTEVPIDRTHGESLGSFSTRKAVSDGIATYSRSGFSACFQDYVPPPGVAKYTLTMELRIVAREGEYFVEDAVPLEANYGDERLEQCVIKNHRGRSIQVPPEVSGRYRLEWKSVKFFQRAPE